MKNVVLFLTAALCSSALSVQARINTLEIDWSHFKGAKTIGISFPKGDGDAGSHTNLLLNEQGQLLNEQSFDRTLLQSITTYKYDAQGRPIERNRATILSKSYLYRYNYQGDRCEELQIRPDGTVFKIIESRFNALGQKISETEIGEDGEKRNSYEYRYDDRGNRTEVSVSRAKDDLIHADWPDSIRTSKNVIRYDEYNNPIICEVYNALGNITGTTHFEYVYDEHHNWTRRIAICTDASGECTMKFSIELAIVYY